MGTVTALHPDAPEPLLRDLLGDQLRTERRRQDRTLSDVASAAGISTQYLSEIERGRKDPSSEVLAAVGGALGLGLLDLTVRAARSLHERTAPRRVERRVTTPSGPVALAA